MTTAIVILLAVLPAVALMIFIFFQDNHEKEPIGLLLKIFFLGVLSVIPVMLFEWLADLLLNLIFGGIGKVSYYAVTAFFGVGIIEEFFKFMAAYLVTWRNKHFNYKFDGIVYCLFGSMGFAATENILYLFSFQDSFLSLGIQRALLAIPAHAMCAIFMGYYYGNAKFQKSYGNRIGCRRNLFIGFLIASSLHAFYDFCLFTGMPLFLVLFGIFVVVADILTVIRIVKAKKENEKMYVAPQYRQYWAGPAANPYQPYGGYAAPNYGGYSYGTNASSGAPSPYAPPAGQNPTYAPQGGQPAPNYSQQTGNVVPNYAQQAGNVTPNYTQQTGQPSTTYAPAGQYSQPTTPPIVATGQSYNPEVVSQGTSYTPPEAQQANTAAPTQAQAPMIAPPVRQMQIHCPVCNTVNYFNAFYCTGCGASLHQLDNVNQP